MVSVYFPKKNLSGELVMAYSDGLPDSVVILRDMIKEENNSIKHLERSIEELLSFDPKGEDSDVSEACTENVSVIYNKKSLICKIEEKIRTLESKQCGDISTSVADRNKLIAAMTEACRYDTHRHTHNTHT
eukprot:GHVR01083738.1.p1 GENE.GHVR01083738.1~~GHVR01083738.1.p1  ORF type:complete len:131 (+),score=37.23 GHVR01083738.1:33-425(+)